MLLEANGLKLVVSRKIFKDKHSNFKNELLCMNNINNATNTNSVIMSNNELKTDINE